MGVGIQIAENRMASIQAHAPTAHGGGGAARFAQVDAVTASGPGERLDPALVRLDRALCMVHDGDVVQGADHAATVLQNLPEAYRPATVWRRPHAVADAIPDTRRGTPMVRALHEVLAISSEPAH